MPGPVRAVHASVLDCSSTGQGDATADPLRVLHTITGLNVGGAEMMLLRLLGAMDDGRFRSSVLSLLPPGPVAGQIAALPVKTLSVGMRRGIPGPRQLFQLASLTADLPLDLVQGWMYHGNLAATFTWWRRQRRPALLWAVHHSVVRLADEKPLTRALIRIGASLSRLPDAIVYCSPTSAAQHEALGYDTRRRVVIANGIDCTRFMPDPAAHPRLCRALGVPEGARLVGMVARWHPMKDHANLLRAVAELARDGKAPYVVLIGEGLHPGNTALAELLVDTGTAAHVHLLGLRTDVAQLVPGLDLLVSPSAYGEALPLAVAEAMAAGVPCVVTEVGDCAWLVGETGRVVPPRDHVALAPAIASQLALEPAERRAAGTRARARILKHFALPAVTRRYEDLYCEIMAQRGP